MVASSRAETPESTVARRHAHSRTPIPRRAAVADEVICPASRVGIECSIPRRSSFLKRLYECDSV